MHSATNIPEQLRKSRRQPSFDVDKQIANRLTLQTRPLARFTPKSRDSSNNRETSGRRPSEQRHFDRGDNNDQVQVHTATMSPAFMMSDKAEFLFILPILALIIARFLGSKNMKNLALYGKQC